MNHTITQNINLTGRQEKIMAILKSDKIEVALNRPNSDMKFYKSSSIKSGLNGDLHTNNSTKFLQAGQSGTFLTQNVSMRSNEIILINGRNHGRKASHAPS